MKVVLSSKLGHNKMLKLSWTWSCLVVATDVFMKTQKSSQSADKSVDHRGKRGKSIPVEVIIRKIAAQVIVC